MSLVFAAVTPHPTVLVPGVGKESGLEKVAQTKQALEQLEQDLYLAKPQLILVISPHEGMFDNSFVVNAHTHFQCTYEDFGDVVTKDEWKGSPDTGAKIAHESNSSDIPVRLVSEEKLSHGAGVPLRYLTAHLPDVKILPIGFSGLDRKQHLAFGEMLKEVILTQDKRIAVIASGDLSHCLTEDAPVKHDETGAAFDQTLIKLLETRNTAGIMQIDEQMIEKAQECGYRSLLILLGMLKDMDFEFKNYAYEYPFGVGYLTGNFVL